MTNTPGKPSIVLVPVDFSDVTEKVIATAVQYAAALGATLHLLHVQEPMPLLVPQENLGLTPLMTPVPPLPMTGGPPALIDRWRDRLLADGITAEATELTGMVVPAITSHAEQLAPVLIVMGSHGHGAMYELLVGSAAHAVLKEATCPVLIVPAANA